MTKMRTTAGIYDAAAYTVEHLIDAPTPQDFLDLIDSSKTELEALEAGMIGQSQEARVIQNRAWSAQHRAQAEIVAAALKAGVPSDKITAITFRETYRR